MARRRSGGAAGPDRHHRQWRQGHHRRHDDTCRGGGICRDESGDPCRLSTLAGLIGDPQVRHRGTIGGSIANADPAADYPAAVLGLGATIVTDRREIAADVFFIGMFQTALEPDEIIVAVRFPIPDAAGYAKFKSQASRFALVGAFVAKLRRHRARRRHGRGPGGVSIQGDRGCAGGGLLAAGADADLDCAVGTQLGHPCRQRVPRSSRGRDGPPRRRAGAGSATSAS